MTSSISTSLPTQGGNTLGEMSSQTEELYTAEASTAISSSTVDPPHSEMTTIMGETIQTTQAFSDDITSTAQDIRDAMTTAFEETISTAVNEENTSYNLPGILHNINHWSSGGSVEHQIKNQ